MFYYDTEARFYDETSGVRVDARMKDQDGVNLCTREYKRGEISGVNASQAMLYHMFDRDENDRLFPKLTRFENSKVCPNGIVKLPNLSIYGTKIAEDAVRVLQLYHEECRQILRQRIGTNWKKYDFKILVFQISLEEPVYEEDSGKEYGTLIKTL